MGTRKRPRQCARCGRMNDPKARQKGLDDELYRLRLRAVGVKSSKDLRRKQFDEFMAGLKSLPDAPRAA